MENQIASNLMGLSFQSVVQECGNGLYQQQRFSVYLKGCQIIVTYPKLQDCISRKYNINSSRNLELEKLNGKLSESAQANMRSYLNRWVDSIEYGNACNYAGHGLVKKRFGFITLTLCSNQMHSDSEIKRKMLVPFLQKLVYHNPSIKYVWKMEAQANGNVHFHLIVDEYVCKEKVSEWWNCELTKLGYIHQFFLKHNHHNPPSTKIETPRHTNDTINYLIDYMGKDESKRLLEGRLWGCSDAIRNLKTCGKEITKTELQFFHDTTRSHVKNLVCCENVVVYTMSKSALMLAMTYFGGAVNHTLLEDNLRQLHHKPSLHEHDIYLTALEDVFPNRDVNEQLYMSFG